MICDGEKLDEKGCNGAPDWIINPMKKTVTVYDFEHETGTNQYVFGDTIPVCIYEDFSINMNELLS